MFFLETVKKIVFSRAQVLTRHAKIWPVKHLTGPVKKLTGPVKNLTGPVKNLTGPAKI